MKLLGPQVVVGEPPVQVQKDHSIIKAQGPWISAKRSQCNKNAIKAGKIKSSTIKSSTIKMVGGPLGH